MECVQPTDWKTRRGMDKPGQKAFCLGGVWSCPVCAIVAKGDCESWSCSNYVDNAGFVYTCGNESIKCEFVYSMATFIQDMSEGMGVNIKLFHTSRRTPAGERNCDALSKVEFKEVRQEMPNGKDISSRASKVLLRWINNPVVTRSLGRQYAMNK